jgi:hypothetical protein
MTQSKIVKKLRKLGYKVTVFTASACNRSGIPDSLISYNGKAIWVEIKIDDDKLSALQKDFAIEYIESWCLLHYDSKTKTYRVSASSISTFICCVAKELQDKLNGVKG